MTKYIADDGSLCETQEEMQAINKRITRLLLPDKIARIFGSYQGVEKAIWYDVNIAKRGQKIASAKW